jgi:hypothetical protein
VQLEIFSVIYFDDRYFLFDGRYILLCGEGLFQFWEGTGGSKTGINALYHKIKKQAEQLTKVVINILKAFPSIFQTKCLQCTSKQFLRLLFITDQSVEKFLIQNINVLHGIWKE